MTAFMDGYEIAVLPVPMISIDMVQMNPFFSYELESAGCT
jgi:hypothetical protein